jgi:hypothetical protein
MTPQLYSKLLENKMNLEELKEQILMKHDELVIELTGTTKVSQRRARTISLELEKLYKQFRKSSVASEKK